MVKHATHPNCRRQTAVFFFLQRCFLAYYCRCESRPGWLMCSSRVYAHTHTVRESEEGRVREWSSIRELEGLVERLLFIGSLCLNWEQRWANNKDETLGERVAFHSALAGIGMWFCCGLLIRSFTPVNYYGITMVVENKTETKHLSWRNYGIINDRDSLSIK